jgi:DMSO/TMAO reductase YedYZ molybdopterin-dependent catalytic subunit
VRTCLLLFFIPIFFFGCSEPDRKPVKEITLREDTLNAEGKKGMILLTDRPPNFETPLRYFKEDYTPNNGFFVRWHLSGLPSSIDENTFRLRVSGHVKKELSLSLNDLKTKFQSTSLVALAECAGNSRSFFDPRVPGGQWKNGGMGNARWTGVKVKDILDAAGVEQGAFDVSFNGMDEPPLPSVPDFVKSLRINHAMDGEVMIAYQMNGEPLPLLNGFPLKLVVPGWYATYWIGILNEIKVYADTFKGYWMQKAYQIPKNVRNGNEKPDSLAKETEPIHKLDVRSIFVSPEPDAVVSINKKSEIEGLAFDAGDSIVKVELSTDGKTWQSANLAPYIGKYSWRRWKYEWIPATAGTYTLRVRATNAIGETQPVHQWNRSGYMRNEIETLELKAE